MDMVYTYKQAKRIDYTVEQVICPNCDKIGLLYLQNADLWTCETCGWNDDESDN